MLRATQFHAFVDWIMSSSKSALGKLPGNRGDDARFPATRGFKVQPVAHEEVAAHAITLIEAGTTNSIEQFGGPRSSIRRNSLARGRKLEEVAPCLYRRWVGLHEHSRTAPSFPTPVPQRVHSRGPTI